MKFRLTPLNLVTSAGMLLLALSYLQQTPLEKVGNVSLSPLFKIVLACLVLVSIITDLIFRFLFKSLRRVWMMELLFMSLTVILFLLLRLLLQK
ncbi:hypothetical protein D9M68_452570 [compost metagenome]